MMPRIEMRGFLPLGLLFFLCISKLNCICTYSYMAYPVLNGRDVWVMAFRFPHTEHTIQISDFCTTPSMPTWYPKLKKNHAEHSTSQKRHYIRLQFMVESYRILSQRNYIQSQELGTQDWWEIQWASPTTNLVVAFYQIREGQMPFHFKVTSMGQGALASRSAS